MWSRRWPVWGEAGRWRVCSGGGRRVGEGRWGIVEVGERGGVVAAGKTRRWVGDGGRKAARGVRWYSTATRGRRNHGGGEEGRWHGRHGSESGVAGG